MAKVSIPTALRQFTDQKDTIECKGGTVGELLNCLADEFGGMRKHLFNDEGKLRSFVNVYLNDEDIRYLEKTDTPVKDSDTISIIPSIAGGRG